MQPGALKSSDAEKMRIMLGLLESVERGGEQSQRRLASELGVALGLVNAYLKRCIKKGLVKVRDAPARRYAYYLTPNGFAEKSQLTIDYLSISFSLFRRAKKDCTDVLVAARAGGVLRIAVLGTSDLAEIAAICALDVGITITAVVDPQCRAERFVGVPVAKSVDEVGGLADAILVTDANVTREALDAAVVCFGAERVLVPNLLGLRTAERGASK